MPQHIGHKELAALHTLAKASHERLSDEYSRRMGLGHGRSDANEEDLAAFCALNDDCKALLQAICALELRL